MCLFATATFWITGSLAYSPGEPRRDVADGVQARQRVERSAVMTGRQIRGAHHGQRRGQQHVLHGRAGGELVVGGGHNAFRGRFLDELHEGLDVVGIENALGHATILPYLAGVPAGEDTADRASRTKAGSKIRSAIT
jgi:hypothetical protein